MSKKPTLYLLDYGDLNMSKGYAVFVNNMITSNFAQGGQSPYNSLVRITTKLLTTLWLCVLILSVSVAEGNWQIFEKRLMSILLQAQNFCRQ